jgi:hypothetical protein
MPDRIDVQQEAVIDRGSGSLDELIDEINKIKQRIDSPTTHSVRWSPLSEDSYEGYGIKVTWHRPETDEEYFKRKRSYEQADARNLKNIEEQAARYGKKLVDK